MRVRFDGCLMVLWMIGMVPVWSQQTTAPANTGQPITTLRTTVHLVVLDIVVNDKNGVPAKGLKQSDFALAEDGVPQTLVSFTEHDGTLPSPPAETLPPNTFAVQPRVARGGASTVIVLDDVGLHDAVYVRKQLREYLLGSPLSTPIALFRRQLGQTYLVQDLTTDRQVLLDAIDSERIKKQAYRDPLDRSPQRATGPLTLRRYMQGLLGRVNLVWFGGGGEVFPDTHRMDGDAKDPVQVLQLSRVALYTIDAKGEIAPDMTMGGATGTIGSFGLGGGGGAGAMLGRGSTMALAQRSGGKAFFDNGFKEAVDEVVRTGSHYYTVSYLPTNHDWNGAYRNIEVQVPGYSVPAGWTWGKFLHTVDETKVQYRHGYVASAGPNQRGMFAGLANSAPDPPERKLISVSPRGMPRRLRAQEDPMQKAMEFSTQAPDQILFTATVTPSTEVLRGNETPADPTLVPAYQEQPHRSFYIHYRIPSSTITFTADGEGESSVDLQFVAALYRDDGIVVGSIATPGRIHFPSSDLPTIMSKPLGFEQTLSVPTTGIFFLRVAVQEKGAGRIGALEVPIESIRLVPISNKSSTIAINP